jgi:copper oxidase (laccase) domain-containing protein
MEPVFTFQDKRVLVQSYGKALFYDPKQENLEEPAKTIEFLAQQVKAQNVLWQRLANDTHRTRRFRVGNRDAQPFSRSRLCTIHNERLDGVVLNKRGDCVAFSTRDCPTLILYSTQGGPIAVMHCSRSSLQGIDLGDTEISVIKHGLQICRRWWGNREHIRGVITLGIAPEHFPNDRYPEIVSMLEKRWGPEVIKDKERSTIDLVALIKAQLAHYGISASQVTHDGLDTFSDPRLASVRAKRGGHNLILVTYT